MCNGERRHGIGIMEDVYSRTVTLCQTDCGYV
jgi:hypothetical protein